MISPKSEIEYIENMYDQLAYLIPRKKNNEIKQMDFLELCSYIGDSNVAPGGWQTIKDFVNHINMSNQDIILDVGSNTGHSSFLIEYYSQAKVIGIDIRSDLVKIGERISRKIGSNVEFHKSDVKNLPFGKGTFSFITTTGTLAFLSSGHSEALSEMNRVLGEDGILVDTCLYYHTLPPDIIISEASTILESNILPYGLEEYISLYYENGFRIKDSYPLPPLKSKTNNDDFIAQIIQREEFLCNIEDKKLDNNVVKYLKNRMKKIFNVFSENDMYIEGKVLFFEKIK